MSNIRLIAWRISIVLYIVATACYVLIGKFIHSQMIETLLIFLLLVPGFASFFPIHKNFVLPKINKILVVAWAVFIFFAFLSGLFSDHKLESMGQIAVTIYFLLFIFLTSTFRWKNNQVISRDLILVVLTIAALDISALVASIFGVPQVFGDFSRFTGWYWNANYVGMSASVALLCLPWLINRFKQNRALFVLLICSSVGLATSLILSGSRGSWLAFSAGLLFQLIFVYKKQTALFLSSVGVGGLIAFAWPIIQQLKQTLTVLPNLIFRLPNYEEPVPSVSTSGMKDIPFANEGSQAPIVPNPYEQTSRLANSDISSGRFNLYSKLLNEWRKDPFSGIGYRNTNYLEFMEGFSAHNIYIAVLVETGLFGFLAFLAGIFFFLTIGWGSPLTGAFLAILISECFESSLFAWASPNALVYWIVFAAFAVTGKAKSNRSKS